MVIDFHTHIFPEKIAQRAVSSLEITGGVKAYGDGTYNGLLESMEKGGVNKSVVLPVVTNTKQVDAVNNYILSLGQNPQLIVFGGVHPMCDNPEELVAKLKKAGARGIKIHPDFVRTFADDNRVAAVINAATENGMPVILHGGADPSFAEYVRCSPDIIARLLPKIPGARLICAHMLGYTFFDRLKIHLDEFLKFGLYFDVSMTLSIPASRNLESVLNMCDSTKILFGTDYPWDSPQNALAALNALNISEQYKENIKYKNAANLLEI